MTVYAVQLCWWMRRTATTRHGDREVDRNARICTLLSISYVFEKVFRLDFETCGTEAEGVVLSIGVTVAGLGEFAK